MTWDAEQLAEACGAWQSGQDTGSSRLRGAARVVTGIPHYFAADFITAHEDAARTDPVSLQRARTLLAAVSDSEALTASGWARRTGAEPPVDGCAGRGIKASPAKDDAIEAVLDSGQLAMPLWGVSLDRAKAESYGDRFLFLLEGPFHAVPAWIHSGIKQDEWELVLGGRYQVTDLDRTTRPGRTIVRLREVATIGPTRQESAVAPA